MKITLKKNIGLILLGFAILAIIFYFMHVILGTINYPGYDSMAQAVSDLTSDDSPSKVIANTFSGLYGVFSSIVTLGLIYSFKNERSRILKLGVILLSVMYLTSAIGYAMFPLSGNNGLSDFQNIMHIVVTVIVVLLTIVSLVVLMIGFIKNKEKKYFILTLITFILIFIGVILTNTVSEAYFGLAERFSVFSVVIYLAIIAYFNFDYHKIKITNT